MSKMLYSYIIAFLPMLPLSLSYKEFEMISNPKIGPKGMPHNKTTDCETFGRFARFNPYTITDAKWFVFYYWAPVSPIMVYEFWTPSKRDLAIVHRGMDPHLPKHLNWSSPLLLMRDVATNYTSLLEKKGDRGEFWLYRISKYIPKGHMTENYEVRIKQTGDNKYLGIVYCESHTAYIMSRFKDIPPKNTLQDEAAKLGYRGRKGKSYLYQGHEWMPIMEMEEQEFWLGLHPVEVDIMQDLRRNVPRKDYNNAS